MRITIVGGGNIGTQFAVHCAEKGHDVIIYTSEPKIFNDTLRIVDDEGRVTHTGKIKYATANPETAFQQAEMIVITLPSMMMRGIAQIIREHTGTDVIICVVPGSGGSECAFRECIERGNTFFGIERVPAIARLITKGRCVRSTGYRRELHVAAIPRSKSELCASIISDIFDLQCTTITGYLNLTMTPSNPILHTTRLKSIFGEWHEGITYSSIPLFYEDWNDESSELLIACDEEVQKICRAFPELDLSHVVSLKDHYESYNVHAMTEKLSSIRAFHGLHTPAIKKEDGWIPDLQSRYFTADFSFGLSIIQQIARFAGVETPQIDSTIAWYHSIVQEKNCFHYADYGIINRKTFIDYYSK